MLPRYSSRQTVSVKGLAAGVYTVALIASPALKGIPSERGTNSQQTIAVDKLVKQ